LVFDEATSSLDSLTEEEISQTIRDVAATCDAITILIAHRLSAVLHADRIYVLERGRIKLLLTKTDFRRIFQVQQDVSERPGQRGRAGRKEAR
jgi:ABC-type multidrug transport system fused ATPase/permease subunit